MADHIIYEVYVRSFRDSDADGIGDLRGIVDGLPYLARLGVDALWLSPIHPSGGADLGYDVTDYLGIDPELGSLAQLDELISRAGDRGIIVLLDLVANHTSDRHPWFEQSRASLASPMRDWYIWRPPQPDGGPPTNWLSMFGGSAWQLDARSGEYYLHTFSAAQPDLNWRNPAVGDAIGNAMRYWLARGIGGFRLDAFPTWIKDAAFRDNPVEPDWRDGDADYRRVKPVHTVDQPEIASVAARLRAVLDDYPGQRLLIAELGLPPARAARYYRWIDVPMNFGLITRPWTADRLQARIAAHLSSLPAGGRPNWVLGNHDVSRVATRLGDDLARVAAVLLAILPGSLTLYFADELGLPDTPPHDELVRDPVARLTGSASRDPERGPMPWDAERAHAGFSAAQPWFAMHPDAARFSVRQQEQDPRSMLSLYRRLLRLREENSLAAGTLNDLSADGHVLSFILRTGDAAFFVAAATNAAPATARLPQPGVVIASSHRISNPTGTVTTVALRGPEAVLVSLGPAAHASTARR